MVVNTKGQKSLTSDLLKKLMIKSISAKHLNTNTTVIGQFQGFFCFRDNAKAGTKYDKGQQI